MGGFSKYIFMVFVSFNAVVPVGLRAGMVWSKANLIFFARGAVGGSKQI